MKPPETARFPGRPGGEQRWMISYFPLNFHRHGVLGAASDSEVMTAQQLNGDDAAPRRLLLAARCLFSQGLEGFGLELAVLLQQDFHFSFCRFQFLTAGGGKLHAFLKQG